MSEISGFYKPIRRSIKKNNWCGGQDHIKVYIYLTGIIQQDYQGVYAWYFSLWPISFEHLMPKRATVPPLYHPVCHQSNSRPILARSDRVHLLTLVRDSPDLTHGLLLHFTQG